MQEGDVSEEELYDDEDLRLPQESSIAHHPPNSHLMGPAMLSRNAKLDKAAATEDVARYRRASASGLREKH